MSLWLPPSATVLSISSAVFDAKVQGTLTVYISANFPVSCAISKSIPSKRYMDANELVSAVSEIGSNFAVVSKLSARSGATDSESQKSS